MLPELRIYFLVVIDKENGKMAGFKMDLQQTEVVLKDEFLRMAGLHNPEGKNIMLLVWMYRRNTAVRACKRTGTPVSSKENGEGEEKRLSLPAWNRR